MQIFELPEETHWVLSGAAQQWVEHSLDESLTTLHVGRQIGLYVPPLILALTHWYPVQQPFVQSPSR